VRTHRSHHFVSLIYRFEVASDMNDFLTLPVSTLPPYLLCSQRVVELKVLNDIQAACNSTNNKISSKTPTINPSLEPLIITKFKSCKFFYLCGVDPILRSIPCMRLCPSTLYPVHGYTKIHPHVPHRFTALSIPYATFVDFLESL
jgi:hypothetical protein